MKRTQVLIEQLRVIFSEIDTRVGPQASCEVSCKEPAIQVTVLECLPMASELIREGSAERWLERFKILDQPENQLSKCCPFYVELGPARGDCSRPRDRFVPCRLDGLTAPAVSKAPNEEYTLKLEGLDPKLGTQRFSIVHAMRLALEHCLVIEQEPAEAGLERTRHPNSLNL